MMSARKSIVGKPLTLQDRMAIQTLELALMARKMQQLQQDQADIMTAFAADTLPAANARNRNAKGWDTTSIEP